jgi:hypothetical protein
MFIITEQWIHENATSPETRIGWTYAQTRALGVEQHKNHGWLQGLIGREITDQQKAEFERQGHLYRVKKGREAGLLSVYRPSKAADFRATRRPERQEVLNFSTF